jgi:hypothetical protein
MQEYGHFLQVTWVIYIYLTSNASHIIFTYLLHSISYYLEGCGRRIEDTLEDIVSGKMKVTDLPKITVILNEGYRENG